MTLKKRVVHPCPVPEVDDPAADYRWTCPGCQTEWEYSWGTRYEKPVYKTTWYGKRIQTGVEEVVHPGEWHAADPSAAWHTRATWVEVE